MTIMTTTTDDRIDILCARCARAQQTKPTAKGEPRLPRGWKREFGGDVWCAACWRTAYKLRAVTIPVSGPVDGTWDELRAALSAAWGHSTTVANWAVRQLLQHDIVRTPAMDAMPDYPMVVGGKRLYLYPGARAVAPDMDTGSVVALLQAVERRYRARRYHVIWRQREAPPTYRYPTPYPVHNQRWSVAWEAATERGDVLPVVTVRLGGSPWKLRLRGGARFGRQLGAARLIADGTAVQGELSIYQRGPDVRCKMVAWLPRKAARVGTETLRVASNRESLLAYWVDGSDEVRRYHADHMVRQVRAHERRLQRLREDGAPEVDREATRARMGVLARKMRARLDAVTHEASAVIAGYAARRGCALVVWDDTDRSYAPSFPWHALVERVGYKLDERGIRLEVREAIAEEDDAE